MTPFHEERIQNAVKFAVDGLLSMPGRERHPFLADFPEGSCDVASFVIGHVLTDRSLGAWRVVTYESDSGQSTRHTWLELPDGSGAVLFTVDATLHQFPDLSTGPYVGVDRSPALSRYVKRINNEPFTRLSVGRWSKPMFEEPLYYVRSIDDQHPGLALK